MKETSTYLIECPGQDTPLEIPACGDVIESLCRFMEGEIGQVRALAADLDVNHEAVARKVFLMSHLTELPAYGFRKIARDYPESWPADLPQSFSRGWRTYGRYPMHDLVSCGFALEQGRDLKRYEVFYRRWLDEYAEPIVRSRFQKIPRRVPVIFTSSEVPHYVVMDAVFVEREIIESMEFGNAVDYSMYCYVADADNVSPFEKTARERYADYIGAGGSDNTGKLRLMELEDAIAEKIPDLIQMDDASIWSCAARSAEDAKYPFDSNALPNMTANGLISPEGEFHPCPIGGHEETARRILGQMAMLDGVDNCDYADPLSEIVDGMGWVLVRKMAPEFPWRLESRSGSGSPGKIPKKQRDMIWKLVEEHGLDTSKMENFEIAL